MLSASASLPPMCAIISSLPPAFANGALHWIALTNDNKQFALVFDLGDEVFRQILLPEFPGQEIWTCLSVYGNSIAGFLITSMANTLPTVQLHTNENRTSCNHGW
nr:hypothetical protein CFP56_33324 [Quercus suber]